MGSVVKLLDCRVLVVEDNYLIGRSLKTVLEDAGAVVTWTQRDDEAYAALDVGIDLFDVLLLDVDLGVGTTGFDIARYARRRRTDIGIIFSSGSPPDWVSSFGVENALFVPKPANQNGLIAAVAIVIGQKTELSAQPTERPFML